MAAVEASIELVLDFADVVSSLPDNVDITNCSDPPPILACGDKSIANAALATLQVFKLGRKEYIPLHTSKLFVDKSRSTHLIVNKKSAKEKQWQFFLSLHSLL